MLEKAGDIAVAKGKKVLRFDPLAKEREAVLKQAMGPSGNLRAPTLKLGDQVVIGFNEELYQQIFA